MFQTECSGVYLHIYNHSNLLALFFFLFVVIWNNVACPGTICSSYHLCYSNCKRSFPHQPWIKLISLAFYWETTKHKLLWMMQSCSFIRALRVETPSTKHLFIKNFTKESWYCTCVWISPWIRCYYRNDRNSTQKGVAGSPVSGTQAANPLLKIIFYINLVLNERFRFVS